MIIFCRYADWEELTRNRSKIRRKKKDNKTKGYRKNVVTSTLELRSPQLLLWQQPSTKYIGKQRRSERRTISK